MDLNWCIFACLLVASVGAARFDLGPQTFTAAPPQFDREAPKTDGVVLYLTPGQIKALEAGGAVVRPAEPDESDEPEAEAEAEEVEDVTDDEEYQDEPANRYIQTSEREVSYKVHEDNQYDDPESNNERDIEETSDVEVNGDVDLDEIFKILDEEQLLDEEEEEEEEEKSQRQVLSQEPRVVEINIEEPRKIPPRFSTRQKQNEKTSEEKYFAPTSDKKARSKIYSAIRYQQPQKPRFFSLPQVQEPTDTEEPTQEVADRSTPAPAPVPRFRLVPYEVEEKVDEPLQKQRTDKNQQDGLEQLEPQDQSEEENDDLKKTVSLSPIPKKLSRVIDQRRTRLFQDELALQAAIRELKTSPKHNDQKYASEIEKLRANLEKQNALAKVEAIARSSPQLLKKEFEKRRPNSSAKQVKEVKVVKESKNSARNSEKFTKKQKPVSVLVTKPISELKTKKTESEKSEVDKGVSVPVTSNIYVKVNKPYLVEHIVPVEIRKELSKYPARKNEKITILRHVWEH